VNIIFLHMIYVEEDDNVICEKYLDVKFNVWCIFWKLWSVWSFDVMRWCELPMRCNK